MEKHQLKKMEIELYQASMGIVRELLDKGIISKEEFVESEALLAKKHCIKDKSIYRLNKLINAQDYGIYIDEQKEVENDSNQEDRSNKKVIKIT